jgi:hypothetical protein
MIPTGLALAICSSVPPLSAYSQTTDQSASAKIGATEFRAISTEQLATFEKELRRRYSIARDCCAAD